jgi:hypothetical protein
MAATTLQQRESAPDAYPSAPAGYASGFADPDFVWQRIESWVTTRWSPRTVVWIVEGPGEWLPPLQPATIETVERWVGEDYQAVVAKASPLGGLCLPELAHYRITATVGAGPTPAIVNQAFIRAAQYLAAEQPAAVPGARSYSVNIGPITESWSRNPAAIARMLEYSGAADLLRSYRRVPCSNG